MAEDGLKMDIQVKEEKMNKEKFVKKCMKNQKPKKRKKMVEIKHEMFKAPHLEKCDICKMSYSKENMIQEIDGKVCYRCKRWEEVK